MSFKRNFCNTLVIISLILSGELFAFNTRNLNAQNGIASNSVHKVFKDNLNRIWLGTENGISIITSNGIRNINFDRSWENNQIWEIYQSPDSVLWFGAFNGGLYSYQNDHFSGYKISKDNSFKLIRKIIYKNNQLFIGGDGGLTVLDYKSKKPIPYRSVDNITHFKLLNFLEIGTDLYFQTLNHGFYKINHSNKTYQKQRNEYLSNYGIFNSQINKDSIFICRGTVNQKVTYNMVKISIKDFLQNNNKIDSLAFNTLAWKFSFIDKWDIYAASWGVNDITGGLYKRTNHSMLKVNELYGIESDRLWDLCYFEKQKKVYLTSIDKGLYIIDMNKIIQKNELLPDENILDIKLINSALYAITSNQIIKIENNHISARISYKQISHFLDKTKPFINQSNLFLNTPLTLREIVDTKDFVGVTTNKGLIYLDYNLEPQKYLHQNGQVRVAILSNDDIMMSTDYWMTNLYADKGNGFYIPFPLDNPANPRDITHSCKVNDIMTLFSSSANKMYLYNQNTYSFKRFNHLGGLKMPCYIDNLSKDKVLFLDKTNRLYEGKLLKDTFLLTSLYDFGKNGVIESYFIKRLADIIVVGTNKGLYILMNKGVYCVNKSMGLPNNIILRTVQYHNGYLFLATSSGMYQISINRLRTLKIDYQLDNLTINTPDHKKSLFQGEKIKFEEYPDVLSILWEVNTHPYPENLSYGYRINNQKDWNKVETNGKITIQKPEYGLNTIYLLISDETNGSRKIIKLVDVQIIKPYYKNTIFLILLFALFLTLSFFVYYKKRIQYLKNKEQEAIREAISVKQKLEILQFLLKPHFIFNALTSIQNLIIEKDFNKSLTYTSYFSKFLRGILDNSNSELISLSEELKNIESYISLEKLRFNEDIQLIIEIDDTIDTYNTLIVPFLFQPIFENTFKHAFNDQIPDPMITLSIHKSEGGINYIIADNGVGLGEKTLNDLVVKSKSKGYKIVLSQLNKFYTDSFTFELIKTNQAGCCFSIFLFEKVTHSK